MGRKKNQINEIPEQQKKLANWTYQKFKESALAKQPYTERWFTYLNAWNNSLFENSDKPSYKTNHISNFIYSTIESMRPVLFDQNPAFEAIPVTADAMEFSNDVTTILDWEWRRTNCQEKLLANSVYTFALGTSIVMLKYEFNDKKNSSVDGEVTPTLVSPFNFYPDPLATNMEDGEYYIYANYVHENILKARYPEKAKFLNGGDVKFSELVNDRDKDAQLKNQILVLEVWCRDYTTIDVEEENGEKITKKKYPRGRVIITAPELSVVLEDKENPYESGRFPFHIFKDIDVPFQFWGEGEVKWLLSPQREANDLYNQVIDNAKATANMQWVIDKNAGIPEGKLTNRPGLIVRKNPGSEVRRDSPPSMPMYVQQMIETLKMDIEVVSGIHDVTRGETPSGIQSAAAIIALQEAAQTRIRLKVTLHENALGVLGTEWLNLIKQFWKFNRVVPRKVDETSQLPTMQQQGAELVPTPPMIGATNSYQMLETEEPLKHDFKIIVRGSSVMQNSRASMLDQMIRLMQTPAEDGMPCVPREAVLDYLPDVNKKVIIQYFDKLKMEQMAQQQQQQVNNEAMQMIQQLAQQVQQLGGEVNGIMQRFQQEDQENANNQLIAQGYEQGMNEAQALQVQASKAGNLPPELMQEISALDDESLTVLMQQHPELLNMVAGTDGGMSTKVAY